MIAAIVRASRSPKPDELPFSRLQQGALEGGPGDIELGHRVAVQPHTSLRDEPARVARRPDAEEIDEKSREMDGITIR